MDRCYGIRFWACVLLLATLLCSGLSTDTCSDKLKHCRAWMIRGYCTRRRYTSSMWINCPYSCKFCTTGGGGATPATTAAPTPQPTCTDKKDCSWWVLEGHCTQEKNAVFMKFNCQYSCGFCTAAPTPQSNAFGNASSKQQQKVHQGQLQHQQQPQEHQKSASDPFLIQQESDSTCGIAAFTPEFENTTRRHSIQRAKAHSWPWMVALLWNDKYICGGTVIAKHWILTAAHCWKDEDGSNYNITAGDHSISSEGGTEQKRQVTRFIRHQDYVKHTNVLVNDIALLYVDESLQWTLRVKPICLPEGDADPNTKCVTAGWGFADNSESRKPDVLTQVKVPIINHVACNEDWYNGNLTDAMICGKDACKGDSGGPLMCQEDGVYRLHGVRSWEGDCANPIIPVIYTNVTSMIEWITNMMSTCQEYRLENGNNNEKGLFDLGNKDHGSTINLTCNNGYKLTPSCIDNSVTCDNGTWTGCTGSVCEQELEGENKEALRNLSRKAKDDPTRFQAEATTFIKEYDGPIEDLLEFDVLVEVLPKSKMAHLKIPDIDRKSPDLFNSLPDAKKLALTRQTLESKPYLEVRAEIEHEFQSKGCGFVGSINASVLMAPGIVSRGMALDLCSCSELESEHIPDKMDILCEIILADTKTLGDFMNIQESLCALCFVHILKIRPTWQKIIVADEYMRNSACDKIGHSFILSPSVLAQWARVCVEHFNHNTCSESRPSLMLHGPAGPSVAELAVCKYVFCHRLCHLTEANMDVICQTLKQQHTEDMGCLAYLDGVNAPINMIMNPPKSFKLNASSIDGSCSLKSRVIKRSKEASQRKNRACNMTCEDITSDVQDGIAPPDVLDAQQLERCFGNNLPNCVQKNNLGDYHWDIEQAKAIFTQIRQELTLKHSQNSTGYDMKVLGYIGVGFTSNELANMGSLSDEVYSIFGATSGWSKEQLQTLASRYMQNRSPWKLKDIDLARLNHLVCGLRTEQVKCIPIKAIIDTTAILGRMQRCEIEVLKVLAQRLKLYYGPVAHWPEDHFSEFGIMLAGLSGEELKAVGKHLVDYVTVPVINHIPPTEVWKLTPEQTSHFSYDASLALSKRGLCAWLTQEHKQGYLEYLCGGAETVKPFYIGVLILLALTITGHLW